MPFAERFGVQPNIVHNIRVGTQVEDLIDKQVVEVGVSDVAFERYVVSGLRHGETIILHKVTCVK